jgi:hypothetical protein
MAGADPSKPAGPRGGHHRPPGPRGRWPRRLAQIAGGLLLGLALAEGAFHVRDHGAFPHLNLYVPDARLGVRLRPGRSQRLAFGANPLTSVRIDREGLRGGGLPPPVEGEVLVVGDSQVFGLGVEEDQTASAELSRMLGGRTVINAGIPTYGPPEYNAVIEEILAKRRARIVVYILNLANDLFEASHPNRERHSVWDGWAVRKETAPEAITWFPGREILFRQSHLVYAVRGFWHDRGPALDERGFASEGTARDLLGAAARAGEEHARADRETEAREAERAAAIGDAAKRELATDLALERLAREMFADLRWERGDVYQKARDNPGDIVSHAALDADGSVVRRRTPEEARGPRVTVEILINGAQFRQQVEERLRALAELVAELEANGVVRVSALPPDAAARWRTRDDPWGDQRLAELIAQGLTVEQGAQEPGHGAWVLGKGRAHPIIRTFEEREALRKRLDEMRRTPAEVVRAWSPMTPILREAKATCDAHGAALLVVALPMDVQVSPAEWAKYGAAPVDMDPAKVLVADLVASAERLGASALDATPALASAEPGAFLDGDIHLTPKGHRALAAAIATKLATTE